MTSVRRKRSMSSASSAVMPGRLPASRHQSRPAPWRSEIARPSVSTGERSANSWLIWKVRAMPSRTRRWGSRRVIGSPSSRISPPEGRNTPASRLTKVVLPAPFGPMSAWRAPFSIASEIAFAATMPPNRLSRFFVSSTAGMVRASLRHQLASGPQPIEPADDRLFEHRYPPHQHVPCETERQYDARRDNEARHGRKIEPEREPNDQDGDDAAINAPIHHHHDEHEPDPELPVSRGEIG